MKETKLDKKWHEEKYLLKGKGTKKPPEAGKFHARGSEHPKKK